MSCVYPPWGCSVQTLLQPVELAGGLHHQAAQLPLEPLLLVPLLEKGTKPVVDLAAEPVHEPHQPTNLAVADRDQLRIPAIPQQKAGIKF